MKLRPAYADARVRLYRGRWQDVLPQLEPALNLHHGAKAIVVTDPPYGTGGWRRPVADRGPKKDGRTIHVKEDWDTRDVSWLGVLPASVPVITFFATMHLQYLLEMATRTGRTKHRMLVWRKPDPKPPPEGRTAWSIEPIWCLSQDGMSLMGGDDYHLASALRPGRDHGAVGHPYQKPVSVLEWILRKLDPSAVVVDPFAGTGTTLVAAQRLGLNAIGIEQDARWVRLATQILGGKRFARQDVAAARRNGIEL